MSPDESYYWFKPNTVIWLFFHLNVASFIFGVNRERQLSGRAVKQHLYVPLTTKNKKPKVRLVIIWRMKLLPVPVAELEGWPDALV